LIGSKNQSWEFTIAARSFNEVLALQSLLNESWMTYTLTFGDGTGNLYTVTADAISMFEPVSNNIEFYDVKVKLTEWS
jgi:hypothetical protein